ncbi:MAG: DUF935 domain-containing protein [Paracoccaceae bacterium]
MANSDTKSRTPPPPELGEIASTGDGRDITSGFIDELAQPGDPKLLSSTGRLNAYAVVLRDDQVKSTLQQRRLAVVAEPCEVIPGGDGPRDREAAEFLEAELTRIGWDRVSEKMLFAVFYGFAVGEVLWEIRDGRVGIKAIKVRNRRRFRFEKDGRLRLVTRDQPAGRVLPERKFWVFSCGADNDDEPYGLGLGYFLYWPAWFKRNGLKSWLKGLDKTARPTAVGKYPAGASQDDIKKLLEALQAMANDTGLAIPEAMELELKQAARTGTHDYDTLYGRMDAAIAKIVLSQTMTTDDGASLSQARVHSDVKLDVIKADADLQSESFTCSVARWITEWNFPGAATPIVRRRVEQPEDLTAAAERDEKLTAIGYKPNEERVRETYGEGYEAAALPASNEPQSDPAFAEGCEKCGSADFGIAEEDAIDGLARFALADDGWVEQMGPVLRPVLDAIEAAETLEEVGERLDALTPILAEMDNSALVTKLAQAAFTARIAGQIGADGDDITEPEGAPDDAP